jgi:hypothetical protein
MRYSIIDMMKCPLSRVAMTLALIAGATFPVLASAKDASLPYRRVAGFTCHNWNAQRECVDWSVYATPPPAYGGWAVTETPEEAFYRYYMNQKKSSVRPSTSNVQRSVIRSRCNNPTVDCTGRVSVRARATPLPAVLGKPITYSMYVRNDDSQIRSVNVRAYLDDEVRFDVANYGGYEDGDIVRWDAIRIPAYGSRTLSMRGIVQSNAPLGTPLQFKVQAGNSVDSVAVDVADGWMYENAIRVDDDGITVRYNQYSGRRYLDQQPTIYHDEFGRTRYRYGDGSVSEDDYKPCDSVAYRC